MTEQEAISYIESFTWSTTRLGLDRTRDLLHRLGDPQKELKFVHVAGSNGKGSTCAMLEAVMRAAGYRTGLYISPYIQDFCERMQVNGQNIPGAELARITGTVRAAADAMEDHPSQFELVTAIAMQYFHERCCDLVVLEVGMGGALDSTNVIDSPEVAVITNIGLEHTEYLGDTLEKIAATKGGIIKPGCTAVCYDSAPEVTDTLKRICAEQNVPFVCSRADDLAALSHSLDGQRFLRNGREYTLSLLGAHQLRNAGVVLKTIDSLRACGWSIPEEAVEEGLRKVRWPARFEVLWREPLFFLDGGHNPQCAEALCQLLQDYLPGRQFCFLLGVLADKDYYRMTELLAPFASRVLCVTPDNPRALPAEALAVYLSGIGLSAQACDSVESAIQFALDSGEPVLAFGSLYLAGQVRTAFPSVLKKRQRKHILAVRDAISPEEHSAASCAVCEKLLSLDVYREAKIIFLFKAFRSELDLSPFAEQAEKDGKTLLYPYCIDRTRMCAVNPEGKWITGRFGIAVPAPETSVVFEPSEIDLVLCPCSAFDHQGRRLGMGAGYYDRFLPQCEKAYKILVAYEAQRLPQVCSEDTDVPMDAIITEERVEFYA